MTPRVEIRRQTPDDWRVVKRVRLAALREAPYASGSNYEREQALTAAQWRSWIGTKGIGEGKAIFVAYDGTDAVGIVGAKHETETSVMLIAMWVAPSARGSGNGRRLTQTELDWATDVVRIGRPRQRRTGRSRSSLDNSSSRDSAIIDYREMTTDTELVRSVLAEQVKERLLQDIFAGRYPPESRIVETRVARELGTSQAPVREALRGLEALGLIEILPFRGARVRRPSADELRDAYLVRTELEVLGARLGVPKMTDDDLADLDRLHALMRKAATKKDRHAVALADTRFHERLLSLAGNRSLERVWRSLEPFQRTYITLVAPGANEQWTANLHTPIIEALHKHDARLVADALRHHFEEATAHLLENWTGRR